MINYKNVKGRSYFGMSNDDLAIFAQVIWLLKHTPSPVGFNRKPFTTKQQKTIDDIYDLINFGEDYAEKLNSHHGQ